MVAPAEHRPFESLPTAVVVVTDAGIVYANPACLQLLHRTRAEMLGLRVPALIDAWVEPDDRAQAHGFYLARNKGESVPEPVWLRMRTGDGRLQTVKLRTSDGPRAGERTYVLSQDSADAEVRRLTDALAAGSWALVSQPNETAVLEAAADTLAAQGFRVVLFRVEGESFRHVSLRQDERARALVEKLAGAPMKALPLSKEQATEFARCLEQRTTLFIQDNHALVDRFRSPEVAAAIKAVMPRRGVVAPVLVEGQPYGLITAQHDTLTPAGVGAIELFAHRVGSAIETVRLREKLVAQERLATLGEAAAVLAHEVRNPVAAILNALALLRHDPQHSMAQRIAEEEANRLERLVRDLLNLARPLEPQLRELDLVDLATRTAASLRNRRPKEPLHIEVVAGGPIPMVGDALLLELALENLLANAVRASPPGGRVEVRLEQRTGITCVAVDDQGPGVGEGLAERVFEPFFTTHATGTGLGLAVVRKVAEAHGGQVRAAQSPLGGARFEMELPRR
ncbi:MAG: PAS domain-containing protein [Deltaproteobacteria bacterium]|nr:PAS domain-containing protein [Deltaproteobacteria bacterium]